MLPRLTAVRYTHGYRIWVAFNDGAEGEIDLSAELTGPIFEPLRNADFFRQFCLDPGLHTLTWPNGADFAPEFLRAKLNGQAPECT